MDTDVTIRKITAEYLLNIGQFLQFSCPPASRFYLSSFQREVSDLPDKFKNKTEKLYCHHCGLLWRMENSITVQARPPNRHIKFLQKLHASQRWKVNHQQKQKLTKFHESTNKIVFKCKACKKITSYPGSKSWSNSRLECTSTRIPVSKIKLRKKDLNAGLLIPSPSSCSLNSTVRKSTELGGVSTVNYSSPQNNMRFHCANTLMKSSKQHLKEVSIQRDSDCL